MELHIENVAHDDAGEYKCVAENDAGRDEQTFFLSIERKFTWARYEKAAPQGLEERL